MPCSTICRKALVATALLLTGVTAGAQQTEPAKPEIVHLYTSENRALAMLRVGDSIPLPVVFDTGTNSNLVDLAVAKRLDLPNTGSSKSVDGSTGKPVPGYNSVLRNARLGGIPIRDAETSVLAFNGTDEVGIFGPNSWPERLVEMDGPRSRLVIHPKTIQTIPTGEAMPYLGTGGAALPSAVLQIDGQAIPAILDSGNDAYIILPTAYKDRLALEAPPVASGYATSAAGRQPILKARLAGTVRMGNVTIVRPKVVFMAGGRPNVGLPVLRRIKIVYDPSASRSWIISPPVTIE